MHAIKHSKYFQKDRAKRHDFRSRFLLIHSLFFLPSFFLREKGKRITKVVPFKK